MAFVALLSFAITRQNLVAGKVFAGHDAGFSGYHAGRMLQLATSVWNIKDGFGFPDFLAPIAIPYAVLLTCVQWVAGGDPARLSQIYYFLALFIAGAGSGWLAVELLAVHNVARWKLPLCACVAAMLAIANPYIAELLNWPVIAFQLGLLSWPAVIAFALNTYRTRTQAVFLKLPLLLVAMLFAFMGNPAHSVLGLIALAALLTAVAVQMQRYRIWIAVCFAVAAVGATAYIWLPTIATSALFHGKTIIREALKYQEPQILADQLRETARASLGNLVRLGGDSWWPDLSVSPFMSNPLYVAMGFTGIILAAASLVRRTPVLVSLWILLIAGIELAKDVHGPLGFYSPAIFAHVGAYAAFRETYDKFALLILIALPPLAAMGVALLNGRKPSFLPAALLVIPLWILLQPFFAGRIADPIYQTTVPADYSALSEQIPALKSSRTLVLPGNYLDLQATTWFVGMNLDSFLLSNNVVNGTMFRERAMSPAPMYGDVDLRSAQELPRLIRILPLLGVRYVVLHKDVPSEHSPRERGSLTLGPLYAMAAAKILNTSQLLKPVFDGRNLAAYQVLSPVRAISAANSLQVLAGYNDALLPLAAQQALSAERPTVVLGNSNLLDTRDLSRLAAINKLTITAPSDPQPQGLYPEQNSLPTAALRAESSAFTRGAQGRINFLPAPSYLGKGRSFQPFNMPRGIGHQTTVIDYGASIIGPLAGSVPSGEWQKVAARDLAPENEYVYPVAPPDELNDSRDETIASRPIPPVALAELPTVDLLATFPPATNIWVRFYLESASGKTCVLDQQIQSGVPLLSYDVRAALQGFLDARNGDRNVLMWRSPAVDAEKTYMPHQADGFRLYRLAFIQSTPPSEAVKQRIDLKYFSLTRRGYSTGFKALQGQNAGAARCNLTSCVFASAAVRDASRIKLLLYSPGHAVVNAVFTVSGKQKVIELGSIGPDGLVPASGLVKSDPGGLIWSASGKRFVLSGLLSFSPRFLAISSGLPTGANLKAISIEKTDGMSVKAISTVYASDGCADSNCEIVDSVASVPKIATENAGAISSREIDPTLYRFTLTKRVKMVTLSETYHPGWVIEPAQGKLSSRFGWLLSFAWARQLAEARTRTHFTVNGYANAWLISDLNPGTYVVDFIPEDIAYLADFAAAAAVAIYALACICAFAGAARRQTREQ